MIERTKQDIKMKTLFIASDHAGFELKQKVLRYLNQDKNLQVTDMGVHFTNGNVSRVDYPDYASLVAQKVNQNKGMGILICGSGQGMCMRANKYPQVRAALCWDIPSAQLARQHNDANVLCLGGRLLPFALADQIVKVFFDTPFNKELRHQSRIQKISQPLYH